MTDEQLEELAPLWGSEADNYVLVRVHSTSTDLQYCAIYDRHRRSAKLIEDPEPALDVIRRMIEAGVDIVDRLPDEQ